MGGICSSMDDDDRKKNRDIDERLKQDKRAMESEVKLLLLGAGESGKSTLFRQLKILHQDGYSEEERLGFIDVIYSNTVQSMRAIVKACVKLGIEIRDSKAKECARQLLEVQMADSVSFSTQIGNWIAYLWKDADIQQAFERKSEYQLNDSARYYFDNIDRLMQKDYMPSEQDVLRSRVKTAGIVETTFSYGGLRFNVFDVGGQRNERRKWIFLFESVTAIIFVVGISEYDQTLYEEATQNRMIEAMLLFDEICNSKWFVDTTIILFMNKTDLFMEKFCQKKVPMKIFPEYTGPFEFKPATDFLVERFETLSKNKEKLLYSHLTCATDTQNVQVVFSAVKESILAKVLKDVGL